MNRNWFIFFLLYLVHGNGETNRKDKKINEKVQQLMEMSLHRSVLKFNGTSFKEFVTSLPRNYSMFVMFTEFEPTQKCPICSRVNDEFTVVANSFKYSHVYSNEIFFAIVYYDETPDIFQMLRINRAPTLIHFPPGGKPNNPDTFPNLIKGYSAIEIAKWIKGRTRIQIRIERPHKHSETVLIVIQVILIIFFLSIRRNNVDFIYNESLWGICAVTFCLIMVSGQMWNHITNPSFLHHSHNGVAYIHESSQEQFVLESYIIILLDAAIVLGMIMMTDAGEGKGEVMMRQIKVITGLILCPTGSYGGLNKIILNPEDFGFSELMFIKQRTVFKSE